MSATPETPKRRKKKGTGAKKSGPPPTPPWWIAGVLGVLLLALTLWAWSARNVAEPNVERGNGLYRQSRFSEALAEYESASGAGPRAAGVHVDRGLARFRVAIPSDGGLPLLDPDASAPAGIEQAQEAFRVAARGGTTSAAEDVDAFLRARAMYDLGNTFFSSRQWTNAMDSYKEALRLRPTWRDAAWNLELARRIKDLEDHPPDANNNDASQDSGPQDSSPPDASDASQDASNDGGEDGGNGDSGPQDGGSGDASGGDSGRGTDGGGEGGAGDASADASTQGDRDGGAPSPDGGAPPRSMAPLDELDRSSRSLQSELLRRRGIVPRGPDDDR